MLQRLRGAFGKWRERRRQYAVERALYKAGAGLKHDEAINLIAKSNYWDNAPPPV